MQCFATRREKQLIPKEGFMGAPESYHLVAAQALLPQPCHYLFPK